MCGWAIMAMGASPSLRPQSAPGGRGESNPWARGGPSFDAPADGEEGFGLDLLAQPSLHVRDEAVLAPVDLVLGVEESATLAVALGFQVPDAALGSHLLRWGERAGGGSIHEGLGEGVAKPVEVIARDIAAWGQEPVAPR